MIPIITPIMEIIMETAMATLVIAMEIPDSIFEAVHDGMQGVMESGTGRGSKIPGITICGKTGTVENNAVIKGQLVKQPNHSFFAAVAPRENPKIAIMCVVENSGRFGGTYAAPIVSLMIEKYINDTYDLQTLLNEDDWKDPKWIEWEKPKGKILDAYNMVLKANHIR